MKKVIIALAAIALVLIVVAVVSVSLFLDALVKKGVETVGPMVTKVDMRLDKVSLSLLSGGGHVSGLVIGNPQGFKTQDSIRVGNASLALEPSSLFSDKIIIRSVKVDAPEITFESDLKSNNLSKILENVETVTGTASTGGTAPAGTTSSEASATRKLQVDEFVLTGGKINVSLTAAAGRTVTVPLPEIRLNNLGSGPEGITPAELTKVVLGELQKVAARASATALADLSKTVAEDLTKGATKAATDAADKVTKGIGDLFKKK